LRFAYDVKKQNISKIKWLKQKNEAQFEKDTAKLQKDNELEKANHK
jgi:hypothetical protein